MKTFSRILATAMMLFGMSLLSVSQSSMDYDFTIEDLEFRPGVTIDINVNVYVNENAVNYADHGKIFAVEGMAHTANCWQPFAEELFLNGPQGAHINEFFAIDMPGRGGSGVPVGWNPVSNAPFLLADMYLEDYIAVIQGAISYINTEIGAHPKTIMGHSLGGLEVILLQDILVSNGTNMRDMYGIKNAILLAPAIPAPLPWSFLGTGAGQLIPMAVNSPDYGWILNIPYTIWPWLFFTNTCCYFPPGNPYGLPPSMVPGAPTPDQVLANGYNSIEAAPLLFHMAGLPMSYLPGGAPTYHPTRPRITVNENIFAPYNKVQLTLIAEEFDRMMTPAEELPLYVYLTGDNKARGFMIVEGEETCHDTHIADPGAIVELLNNPGFFKSSPAGDANSTPVEITVYPNPSSGFTSITYTLPDESNVKMTIYNVLGQKVVALADEVQPAGTHQLEADLSALRDGMYLLQLDAGPSKHTRRIVKN